MQRVVVIGGGPSGLAAACSLLSSEEGKFEVLVLEARDRLGGRTYTTTFPLDNALSIDIDLGGQWLAKDHKRAFKLCDTLGLKTKPQWHQGTKLLHMGSKTTTYTSDIPLGIGLLGLIDLQLLIWRASIYQKLTHIESLALIWDEMSTAAWLRSVTWTEGSRKLFESAIRAVFGVEPAELNLLNFFKYCASNGGLEPLINIKNGAQEFTIIGGAQQLSNGMAKMIAERGGRILFHSEVVAISNWDSGKATVSCRNGTIYEADHIICAIPTNLIPNIDTIPNFPPLHRKLFNQSYMGKYCKIFVLYPTAFWRSKGFSGEFLGEGISEPVFLAFDYAGTRSDGQVQPGIVGFSCGDPGYKWFGLPAEERKKAVIAQYVRLFGHEAAQPLLYVEKDWSDEKFSRGCPVANVPTGMMWQHGEVFRQPTGCIHFAGTETAREFVGYIEGALQSGEAAAQSIIRKGAAFVDQRRSSKWVRPWGCGIFELSVSTFLLLIVILYTFYSK
jgi:monoamine oxidase